MLLIVWVVYFAWLYVHWYKDYPPAYDADLIPVVAPIPDAQNSYPVVMRLAAESRLNDAERYAIVRQFEGEISSATVVQAYIARSSETIALFSELAHRTSMRRPGFEAPSFPNSRGELPYWQVYTAARLRLLQADALARRGRTAKALEICMTTVDVGRIFAKGPELSDSLVGMGLIDLGTMRALRYIRAGGNDRSHLLAATRRLNVNSGAIEGLQTGFRYQYRDMAYLHRHMAEYAERLWSKPTLLQRMSITLAKYGLSGGRPNLYIAWQAAANRRLIAAVPGACSAAGLSSVDWPPLELHLHQAAAILTRMELDNSDKIFRRRCATDFRLGAAAVAAAAQAYRADHGRFPDRLEDLAPRYIAAVPIDPFNGAAPIYSAHDGAIHSVGTDADGNPLWGRAPRPRDLGLDAAPPVY